MKPLSVLPTSCVGSRASPASIGPSCTRPCANAAVWLLPAPQALQSSLGGARLSLSFRVYLLSSHLSFLDDGRTPRCTSGLFLPNSAIFLLEIPYLCMLGRGTVTQRCAARHATASPAPVNAVTLCTISSHPFFMFCPTGLPVSLSLRPHLLQAALPALPHLHPKPRTARPGLIWGFCAYSSISHTARRLPPLPRPICLQWPRVNGGSVDGDGHSSLPNPSPPIASAAAWGELATQCTS